jgi:curved DNA-binding protein CbpA
MKTQRKYHRQPTSFPVKLYWEDASGTVSTQCPRTLDTSEAGMCLECSQDVPPGTHVYMHATRYGSPLEAVVRYSIARGDAFRVGLEFSESTRLMVQGVAVDTDYYEALQLSPRADIETITRVYRIMAKRFHPDNSESGDPERFLLLSEAYRVLSNPDTRARYDSARQTETPRPMPMFQARAFVDEKQGEVNRRLGVLCLLYAQRRRNQDHPSISLLEMEELMAIPREYLEFTLWYLKEKKYLEMNQGADFVLTACGVDFVEEHTPAHAMMRKLLQDAGGMRTADPAMAPADLADFARAQ